MYHFDHCKNKIQVFNFWPSHGGGGIPMSTTQDVPRERAPFLTGLYDDLLFESY